MNVREMIYIRDQRIIFTPKKEEFDITDHIDELIEELGNIIVR